MTMSHVTCPFCGQPLKVTRSWWYWLTRSVRLTCITRNCGYRL
ncbi:MAG TPA: hypothetical protein VMJ73_09140 [Rhizomicrobium sp.]|nr:hypothetical protein [Rhizomicrobium sp.]